LSHAVADCQRLAKRVEDERWTVKDLTEQMRQITRKKYDIYSVRRRDKITREGQIRDWRNYKYKLEVWRRSLNPAAPQPVAPVFAFAATPTPSEKDIVLAGAIVARHAGLVA
jgi:hypothetical protein